MSKPDKIIHPWNKTMQKTADILEKEGATFNDKQALWEKDNERYTILTNGTVERYYTKHEEKDNPRKPNYKGAYCIICGETKCNHTVEDVKKHIKKKARKNMSEGKTQQENVQIALELGFEPESRKPGLYSMEDEFNDRPIKAYVDFREDRKQASPRKGVRWAVYVDKDDWEFINDPELGDVESLSAYKKMRDDPSIKPAAEPRMEKYQNNGKQEAEEPQEGEEDSPPRVVVNEGTPPEVGQTKAVALPKEDSGVVTLAVTPNEFKQNWDQYQEFKKAVTEPSDIQKIGDKNFPKKSYWRKVGTAFNLTDEITSEQKITRDDGSFYWKMKVRATAPNGRSSEGVGICDSSERKFSHPEHDVYATCHTRAKNRAISDLVGGGEVSYEEVGD